MATRIQVVSNGFPALRARLALEIPKRLEAAANDLRGHLELALNEGMLPIQSDTVALADAITVQTQTGDDSAQRLAAAKSAYLAGGQWTQPIREHVTPSAYTTAHFDERVGSIDPLPLGHTVGVVVPLGWGFWWEFGHSNVFTGKYEHRPWMLPAVQQWASVQLKPHFAGLIQ